MRIQKLFAGVGGGLAVAALTMMTLAAQAPAKGKYSPPRLADGRPDLQGVWANNNITPLQRPKEWADKSMLTQAEMEQLKRDAAAVTASGDDAIFGDNLVLLALQKKKDATSRDGCRDITKECVTPGNYNSFWLVERDFDNLRTSLVIDPPDGRIPPMTPEAIKRQQAEADYRKLHPADGPEDRPLGERCANASIPRLGAGYMNYYQITQTPHTVTTVSEMYHDHRIIPMDGRSHVDKNIRLWNGDPRGRWEGDTLVVETTNFSTKSEFMGSHENLTLVERYTRVGPETLNYEVTISDPTTWTKPWTVLIPLKLKNEAIYEFACHEGNEGMRGILAGARAEEQRAASRGSKQ